MIRRNIIANVLGRAWGIVAVYIFVPIYLEFLGIEAYGLIGFYSTLLAICAFADMGLTATLNREMARLALSESAATERRGLLRTYELPYGLMSLLLSGLVYLLAPWIAQNWLQTSALQVSETTSAIRLMGVGIALQLPAGLFIGGLMGLHRQVLANSIQVAWGAFRGIGSVLVLWLWSPTILAFFWWQVLANVLYCFFSWLSLWASLPTHSEEPTPRFDIQVLRRTWRYALGMAGLTLIGLILSQTDKLVVSKLLTLETFGYYTLAGTLAVLPLTLANTIATALFPRLTEMVASADGHALEKFYHKASELVGGVTIPLGLTLALFAGDFVFVWTGSVVTADKIALVATLLVMGQVVQATTVLPYYLALAHGNVRYSLRIGVVAIVFITPLLILLVMRHGMVGAGVSWVVLNMLAFPANMYLLHRSNLSRELARSCLQGVGRPLFASLPAMLFGYWLMPDSTSRLFVLFFLTLIWGLATAASMFILPTVRVTIMENGARYWNSISAGLWSRLRH